MSHSSSDTADPSLQDRLHSVTSNERKYLNAYKGSKRLTGLKEMSKVSSWPSALMAENEVSRTIRGQLHAYSARRLTRPAIA
jgi:hypothetical protein